jgi:ketosteroid isomerase-like protein
MRRRSFFAAAAALAAFPLRARAQTDAVLRAETAFLAALRAADGDAIAQLLADEFVYQHVTGNDYSKADIVRIFATREITVDDIGPIDVTIRDYGEVALSFGSVRIAGALGGTRYAGRLRFVDLWRRDGGAWRLVHRNSQLLP